MKISKLVAALMALFFAFIAAETFAQNDPSKPDGCPKAVFLGPKDISAGFPLVMPTMVVGGDPNYSATYNWIITGAKISDGQGTSRATFDTATLPVGTKINIVLELGGTYPCPERFETTAEVKKTAARFYYIYDEQTFTSQRNAKLQALAKELIADPKATAYIFGFDGYGTTAAQAKERADKARDYILSQGITDTKRIVRMDGGQRSIGFTEIWLTPPGAKPPSPNPAK